MSQNFIDSRREQGFLLPPDVREWLPEDHLAWFVIDAVGRMDLRVFYAAYRADGHGRAAYEPSVMVAVILYAFATNVESSRAIERHCRQDVAYRVITGNLIPDHATIARFICRHEQALAELFTQVLKLCDQAGLVKSGVVAIDGTKVHANASRDSNVDYDRVANEIIAEAIATDEAEDERYGEARGDELPAELSTEEGRREWLARHLDQERSATREEDTEAEDEEPAYEFDAERIVARVQGREGGCGRPSASSTRTAGLRRGRFLVHGLSGCARRAGDWRGIWPPSAAATRPTRSIGCRAAPRTAGGSQARRSRISRRRALRVRCG